MARTRSKRAPRIVEDEVEDQVLDAEEDGEEEDEAPKARSRRSRGSGTRSRRRAEPVVEEAEEADDFEDGDEEEEAPKPKARSRRARKPKVVEAEEEADDAEEAEEAPKPRSRKRKPKAEAVEEEAPAKRTRRSRKPKAEAVEVDDGDDGEVAEDKPARRSKRMPEADAIEEPVEESELVKLVVAVLDANDAIVLRKVEGDYVLQKMDAVSIATTAKRSTGSKGTRLMSWAEWEQEVFTDDYMEFREWWSKLTFEEKVKEAEKEDVEWERHETPRVDNMRCTQAYRETMEIDKFKPEYTSKAARDTVMYG